MAGHSSQESSFQSHYCAVGATSGVSMSIGAKLTGNVLDSDVEIFFDRHSDSDGSQDYCVLNKTSSVTLSDNFQIQIEPNVIHQVLYQQEVNFIKKVLLNF